MLPGVRQDRDLSRFPVQVLDKHDAAAGHSMQHAPPQSRSRRVHFVVGIERRGGTSFAAMTRRERDGRERALVVDEVADGHDEQRLSEQMRQLGGGRDVV